MESSGAGRFSIAVQPVVRAVPDSVLAWVVPGRRPAHAVPCTPRVRSPVALAVLDSVPAWVLVLASASALALASVPVWADPAWHRLRRVMRRARSAPHLVAAASNTQRPKKAR